VSEPSLAAPSGSRAAGSPGRRLRPRPAPPRPEAGVARAAAWRESLRLAPLLVYYLLVCAVVQPGPDPVRDEPDLLAAAARLLDGQLVPAGGLDPRAYLWHGPGLVALLAPFAALGVPLTAMRFVEPLLLGAAMIVFHRLLRVRLAPRPALGWTYALGLYVPFLSVVPEIHKEPLAILLVVAGMLALTRGLRSGSRWALAGAGLALTALTMVRLEYGWVAIALLVLATGWWALRRRDAVARRLVVVAAVAVAGCVPWLATTYRITGEPLYWGSSSGLSLLWMSPTVSGESGQWREPEAVAEDPVLAPLRPLFERVARLDPVAGDLALREVAFENIRDRPLGYARNLVANTTRMFFAVPMRPELSAIRIGANVLFNGLLLIAVTWAAVALYRRRPALPPEAAPIALFAALGVAVHLPASSSPRMLLPIVPALLWCVAQVVAAAGPAGASRAARTS